MNRFIGMGRMTANPDIKYQSGAEKDLAITRFSIAIERPKRKGQEKAETDFIRCVAFGNNAEFIAKYFEKGKRILVEGRLQIGSYTNKDNVKIPTADIVVEHQEFADGFEKKKDTAEDNVDKGFMDVAGDEEIPF